MLSALSCKLSEIPLLEMAELSPGPHSTHGGLLKTHSGSGQQVFCFWKHSGGEAGAHAQGTFWVPRLWQAFLPSFKLNPDHLQRSALQKG